MNDETNSSTLEPDEADATETPQPSKIGRIEWMDLTVQDATRVRNFYTSVVGWTSNEVSMGHYSDFNLNLPDTGDTIAGVCHAKGSNANLPSQWLIYVRVESVKACAAQCTKLGGLVLDGPRRMGGSNFCVIQDPAGAVLALISD
ncbi:MAG: VOC family protein [Pseudohongiellaceae bacterium]